MFISNFLNKKSKINLLNMDYKDMCDFFISIGEEKYRAIQVMKWIYHNYCDNFDSMSTISKKLRDKLNLIAIINAPNIVHEQRSVDGTIKWSMCIDDTQLIETVYIPENKRATLCISSQIGCILNCTFCSTGQQGFNRNLHVWEIIGQIWRIAKIINYISSQSYYSPITNIVLMGMGEPLLNLKNVVTAIRIMTDKFGFGFSKRRITLSTVGIVPALDKLSDMIDVVLAISLHAPTNDIRNKIMPINKKYNIDMLLNSAKCYLLKTRASRGYVTIEYVMLNNVNDRIDDAYALIKCLYNIPCKINLIPWNYVPNTPYFCSSDIRINRFVKILKKYGLTTVIRKIRGHDIDAACGQLTGHVLNYINNKKIVH